LDLVDVKFANISVDLPGFASLIELSTFEKAIELNDWKFSDVVFVSSDFTLYDIGRDIWKEFDTKDNRLPKPEWTKCLKDELLCNYHISKFII